MQYFLLSSADIPILDVFPLCLSAVCRAGWPQGWWGGRQVSPCLQLWSEAPWFLLWKCPCCRGVNTWLQAIDLLTLHTHPNRIWLTMSLAMYFTMYIRGTHTSASQYTYTHMVHIYSTSKHNHHNIHTHRKTLPFPWKWPGFHSHQPTIEKPST